MSSGRTVSVGLDGRRQSATLSGIDQLLANVGEFRKALMSLFIPSCCTALPEQFVSVCSSLSRVTFASGSVLKRIDKEAFSGCSQLREIEIPASVEEIGEGCFNQSSLSRFTFASGSVLKRIGKEAFSGCSQLQEIEIPASIQVVDPIGVRVVRL